MKRRVRPYEMRRRAERQAETRRRIVDAAVALHGSIGPLATTISAIAERAGVERETVYRHFPDEPSLFAACTLHYFAAHPGPALERWRELRDPVQRLEHGLLQLYAYYAETEDMTASILRDAEVAPDRIGAGLTAFQEAARAILLEAWGPARSRRTALRAAIGHASRFETWRSLVREEGLSVDRAVDLMIALAREAERTTGRPARSGRSRRPAPS